MKHAQLSNLQINFIAADRFLSDACFGTIAHYDITPLECAECIAYLQDWRKIMLEMEKRLVLAEKP